MLWLVLAFMCLVAIGFTIRPLLGDLQQQRLLTGIAIVFVAAASAGLYSYTGSPDVSSGASQQPDVSAMVASLAARLERQPDDVNGWKMLGRSYMTLGNFQAAVSAYERAVELESAQNAQTLVDLGVAMAQAGGQQLSPQAVSVFENAIALDPNHPEALFWSGIGAFNRGDAPLAATRWEQLLATNPPAEVRAILEQRIAAWRGEAAVPAPRSSASQSTPAEQAGAIVHAAVSVSDAAATALPVEATVYVIARDPAQPSPPIAVARRLLSELPAVIELSDRESMVPGRSLSGFAEFELVARVSVSGSPAAQPGDWFSSTIVRPADDANVSMSIDTQVP
ncbi:MAG: tetratricopeptide repeat protein [Gammaproteobacteria bacterium]|nr:tetratricopeptide repeat protein [Gammaproteobacteria bacterium]